MFNLLTLLDNALFWTEFVSPFWYIVLATKFKNKGFAFSSSKKVNTAFIFEFLRQELGMNRPPSPYNSQYNSSYHNNPRGHAPYNNSPRQWNSPRMVSLFLKLFNAAYASHILSKKIKNIYNIDNRNDTRISSS